MNAKLALIQRRMDRQSPEKVPAPEAGHGLGAALESLIADEVERRVGEAIERKPPAHVQRIRDQFDAPAPYRDYREIPPPPRTPTPKAMQATIERDGAGLARAIVINGERFLAQRNGNGQLIGVISDELVSEVRYGGKAVPQGRS